jgi:hypothetical protein
MATRTKRDDEGRPEEEGERKAPALAGPAGERDSHAALLAGLEELVPGLTVLDRELALEGGARAELVATDPAGRLVLVQLAPEDPDRAALDVLELLAALARDQEPLARHLGFAPSPLVRAPRVLVVSASSDARLAARLAPLASAGVELVGLRSVKSAAGERAYLVRLDAAGRPVASAGGVAAFVRALSARQEPLVRALLERMQRLDEELAVEGDAETLVWRLAGRVLARLERLDGGLTGSVAPGHEPEALAEAADVERFVERALSELVRVLGLASSGPTRPAPSRDEPLLTAEEIQAFRE